MVTRRRLRTVLNTLALYAIAALVIGYFGVNAYTGNRGLKARQDLDLQITQLTSELEGLKSERATWERRVALLKSNGLDPDMLDERAARVARLRRSPRPHPAHKAPLNRVPSTLRQRRAACAACAFTMPRIRLREGGQWPT